MITRMLCWFRHDWIPVFVPGREDVDHWFCSRCPKTRP